MAEMTIRRFGVFSVAKMQGLLFSLIRAICLRPRRLF